MNQENEDNKDETQLSPIKNIEKEKIEELRKTIKEQMIPQQDNSIQDSIKKSPEFKEDQNRLITNNMIFIIPSWGELLGYPHKLGLYMNTQVAKIQTDFVIFYSGVECALKTNYGLLYYLFGLGYYYTKFELLHTSELTSGKYITDSKILTGLILSDFVYDKLASSENLTLEDDPDVIIARNVIKVPIDVAYKDQNKQTLIKGAVMRNIFIPYKDIILGFMEKIRTLGNFNLNLKGHQILSTHPDYYNKILVSDKMNAYDPEGYMNSTAIIDEIRSGVDEILVDSFSPVELKEIDSTIDDLSTIYSTLEFDPVYPYSIIENASKKIIKKTTPISQRQNYGEKELTQKMSIFYSAETKLSQIKTWPNKFPRYRKQDVELIDTPQKTTFPQYIGDLTSDLKGDKIASEMTRQEPNKENDFKLRFEQSKRVSEKVLPNPPKENIEKILLYVKQVVEEDFDAPNIGKALGLARDNIKNIHPVEYHTIKWELSKWANLYEKRESSIGLSPKERNELLEGVQKWLNKFEEERLERERLEREERERLERERLERERLERERMEKERLEEERKKLEEERKERERLNQLKEQQEILRKQREQEKLEFERQQKLKKEKKRIEEEKKRQEALESEAQELKKLKKERKKKEKLLKKQRKKQKKLEKKRLKIERKKAKEREKLKKIKSKLESNE